MGTQPAVRLAAPLISAGAFLGVSAAWLFDVNVFSPALNHPDWEYLSIAGPYVVMGVFNAVYYFARPKRVFLVLGLIGALFTAGIGMLMWYSHFSGTDRDWGLIYATIVLWVAAVAITATGLVAMLIHKAWQWRMPRPTDAKNE
jgi:hypothetical protein